MHLELVYEPKNNGASATFYIHDFSLHFPIPFVTKQSTKTKRFNANNQKFKRQFMKTENFNTNNQVQKETGTNEQTNTVILDPCFLFSRNSDEVRSEHQTRIN